MTWMLSSPGCNPAVLGINRNSYMGGVPSRETSAENSHFFCFGESPCGEIKFDAGNRCLYYNDDCGGEMF
jgi:hypothetical protein